MSIGLIIIVLGVLTILFEVFKFHLSSQEKIRSEIRLGAVIFIGPIPIILGTDKGSAVTVSVLSIDRFGICLSFSLKIYLYLSCNIIN